MSNIVILEGHLGADVELKHTTANGVPVTNFRMATNRKYTNAQQQRVEDSQWHNVVCWNKTAISVATYMRKGSHVLVEGRLQTREFMGQTKYENGQVVADGAGNPILVKRYTTEIVASRVQFLDKKPATAAYPQTAAGIPVQPAAGAAPVYYQPVAGQPAAAAPVVVADPNAVASTFVGPAIPVAQPVQAVPAGAVPVNAVPAVNVQVPAGV
jgi:single-strand DNA-binding protein